MVGAVLIGFDYHRPGSEQELRRLLGELGDDTALLAGGTDVLVQMRNGRLRPRHVVDLAAIETFRRLHVADDGGLDIGATATVSGLVRHPHIQRRYQALAEGGSAVGSVQIQNRATPVGNICNASPAADTVPALLVFDTRVNVAGVRGPRTVPLADFLRGPGQPALAPGEWVESIQVPSADPCGSSYIKLGRTRGVDLAVVGVACRVSATGAAMSFASVAPTAVHLDISSLENPATELAEETEHAIRSLLSPIDDIRGSAAYRTEMALVLARRALDTARRRFMAARETAR